MQKHKTAVIGLGNIGGGIASCLAGKGYALSVYDADKTRMEAFAEKALCCEREVQAAQGSEVILLSLPTTEIVEQVVEKLIEAGVQGKTILDLSTSFPISTRALAKRVCAAGGALLDAPLLAGPDEAAAGTLTAMVAGDADAVRRVDALLMDFCSHYDHVGQSGNAHLMKLMMNFTGLTYALLLGQMFPLAERSGLDPQELYRIMDNDVFSNWMYRFYAPKMIDRSYDMAFSLKLGLKDLTYVKRLYDAYNVPAFVLDGALDLLRAGMKEGRGDQDFSRCAQVMYEYLGLPDEREPEREKQ